LLAAQAESLEADLGPLVAWLAGQPAWSGLPFNLVAPIQGGAARVPLLGRAI
jgi:hypothetical protein